MQRRKGKLAEEKKRHPSATAPPLIPLLQSSVTTFALRHWSRSSLMLLSMGGRKRLVEYYVNSFFLGVVLQYITLQMKDLIEKENFRLVSSPELEVTNVEDDESGKDCVICLPVLRNTDALPCRHMPNPSVYSNPNPISAYPWLKSWLRHCMWAPPPLPLKDDKLIVPSKTRYQRSV